MKINPAGLSIIKSFESLRLHSYQDTGSVWTIGYGHTRNVGPGMEISPEQAEGLLWSDVEGAEWTVEELTRVPLNENEFSALVSFVFNIGFGQFQHSTMLQMLKEGDYTGAAEQFGRWNKDNGKILIGLIRRRKAERELFLTPPSPTPHP